MLDFFEQEINSMNPASATSPRKCLQRLRQFAGNRKLKFADVNADFVADFRTWLANNGLRPTVIADYSQRFRALYRRAVRCGLAPETDAFNSVEKRVPKAEVKTAPIATRPDCIHWYALRLLPGAILADQSFNGLDIYNPSVEIARRVGSRMAVQARSAIHGVVFLRTSGSAVPNIAKRLRASARFYTVDSSPAIIPDAEMYCFRRTIGLLGDSMEFLPLNRSAWQCGRKVRITDGPFAGYEGLLLDVTAPDGTLLRDIPVSLISTFGFTVRATIPDIYISPLP